MMWFKAHKHKEKVKKFSEFTKTVWEESERLEAERINGTKLALQSCFMKHQSHFGQTEFTIAALDLVFKISLIE
jgi:hypothetical protein